MGLFFAVSFVCIFTLLAPAHYTRACWLFCGETVIAETGGAGREINSQNMLLAEATRNPNLNQENDEIGSIAAMEGSALSAVRSVSSANSDKPINSGDQISVYVVKEGDTLSQIAKMFGVSENTIRFANDISRGGSIRPGQQLVILPVSGIQYTIKKGDTISKIAKNYSADAQEIRDFNGIDDASLAIGDTIIIPNGVEAPKPASVVTSVKKFISNIISSDSGVQTSGYFVRPAKGGKTQGIHGHNGVDFSGRGGLSVVAAASGKVLISLSSGYNGGYGKYVVIAHPNGTQTLYAHLSANFVSAGESVTQGQLIGNIGNTGLSTGPHLHFEVRGAKNPF
ncbi:MAG: M23 family metallopeptidase [Candidatus Paceibacterota bacterium]|jgi:murein DD-endopeptidase MepM/ murein hydrolase activator NlpD|nr:M23 family metallopeptidase [Candidatus Paceibacterota bacterium]